jgi:hypothetical protein
VVKPLEIGKKIAEKRKRPVSLSVTHKVAVAVTSVLQAMNRP